MDVLFPQWAGLDVHRKPVMACRVTPEPTGQQAEGLMERRALGTLTADRLALSDWVAAAGSTQVAMESPGAYGQSRDNLLAGEVTVFLGNAAHVQQVPGRKTDQADVRWLATRMRQGLLPASVSPALAPRDWRDLTRDPTRLVQERRRAGNRVPGVWERAHLKLAAVATASLGVSARAIVAAVVEGRADPATMAERATRRRRRTLPLREPALTGRVRDPPRQLRALPWAPSDCLDAPIDRLSAAMTRRLAARRGDEPSVIAPEPTSAVGRPATPEATGTPLTLARAVTLLDTIPGVHHRGGERRVAEWGIAMARLGTAARLAAWRRGAPGHETSAGKPRSGTIRPGHHLLRTGLTPWAHAAARTQGTSLATLAPRLAARRGKQRAIMAVAHAMVVSAFHLRSRHEPYRELGAHDVYACPRTHLVDRLTRRIERLGYPVRLEPVTGA